jgi:acyl-CoA reductase-like NAD-dependent aldehyde dehydrogenase
LTTPISTKPPKVTHLTISSKYQGADISTALAALKWRHAGQACITANRVYVQRGVYKKFTELMLATGRALHVGHGADPATTMGPLTTPRGLDKAQQLVDDAREKGANILLGGNKLDRKGGGGYFFEPTLVVDAHEGLLLATEEQFAPVMALFPFETEEEVVEKANSTSVSFAMADRCRWFEMLADFLCRWDWRVISSRRMWIGRGGCWRTSRLG